MLRISKALWRARHPADRHRTANKSCVKLKVVIELGFPRCLVAVSRVEVVPKTLPEPTGFVPFGSLTGQSDADDVAAHYERVDARDIPQV